MKLDDVTIEMAFAALLVRLNGEGGKRGAGISITKTEIEAARGLTVEMLVYGDGDGSDRPINCIGVGVGVQCSGCKRAF